MYIQKKKKLSYVWRNKICKFWDFVHNSDLIEQKLCFVYCRRNKLNERVNTFDFSRPIEEIYTLFVYHLKVVSVYSIRHSVVNRWVRVATFLVFFVVFCRRLFILLFFFFCPLYYLSFDLRLLNIYLVSTGNYELHVYFISWIVWFSYVNSVYPWKNTKTPSCA